MNPGGFIDAAGVAAKGLALRGWGDAMGQAALDAATNARARPMQPLEQAAKSLVARSAEDIRAAAGDLGSRLVWHDDGQSVGRAAFGALSITQRGSGVGAAGAGAGALATADGLAAGMAVAYGPKGLPGRVPFYAATVVKDTAGELRVIDHLVAEADDGVLGMSEWLHRIGGNADDTRILSPADEPPARLASSAGIPPRATSRAPARWNGMAEDLAAAWERVGTEQLDSVHPLFRDPRIRQSDIISTMRIRPSGWDPAAVEARRHVLATGSLVQDGSKTIGNGDARNGRLYQHLAIDQATGAQVPTILKTRSQGGVQEVFAYDVARSMGIEDLFATTAWREADVAAAIEVVPGRTLGDGRLSNSRALRNSFADMVRARSPQLDGAELLRRAEVERQHILAFDYLTANGDRHPGNGLLDPATRELRFIDHGLVNRYPADAAGAVPTLRVQYADPFDAHVSGAAFGASATVRRTELLPEVVESLRALDRTQLVAAFDRMQQRLDGARSVGAHATAPTATYLDEMLVRLDSAIENGAIHYRTI